MKVLLFANTDWYLYNFRLELAQSLRARGDEVVLLSPPGEYAGRLEKMGYRWIGFPLDRRGMNPLREARSILRLRSLYRRERPDLVHHFTVKCVLYGSLAARLTGARAVVNSITGLGYLFLPGGALKNLLRVFVRLWYRNVLHGSQVIFENEEDRAAFVRFGFVRSEEGHLTAGVGVDVQRFAPSPFPEGDPVVLMAARLLWDKGVGEFVEAARQLRCEGVQARFALSGRTDPGNPASIPGEQVAAWRDEGVIEWWGWAEDMAAALAQASIVCLPSYREGLPTVLTEAAACGRPVIASDVPGCREALEAGVSGLLVPVKDARALAGGMRRLILDPELCRKMGAAGRALAVDRFSSARVLEGIFSVYRKALAKGAYDGQSE